MSVCRHVFYSGRVQGVGFRYTASNIARQYAIAGFVRNLPDGRVELVAEGEDAEVERFLDAVRRQMAGGIENAEVHAEPPQGLTEFRIEHA